MTKTNFERQFGEHLGPKRFTKSTGALKKIKSRKESLKIVSTVQAQDDPIDVFQTQNDGDVTQLTENDKLLSGYQKLSTKTTILQQHLFKILDNYQDLFYFNETQETELEIQRLIAIHCLNHVCKSRDVVVSNSQAIKKDPVGDIEYRDQGFTRPTVLILLPFKNDAYMLINNILTISGCTVIENQERFEEEFFAEDEPNPRKPKDYNHTFKGNNDDCFKIGLKFSKKQCKLYSSFYSSDILVCSPLGLEMIIGKPGDSKRDYDYLSSIEIICLDKADLFLMQNFDHVWEIFNHLNLIPKVDHGCDFSRAKNYVLDGDAKYARQTILFSHIQSPQINSLCSFCFNVSGNVKISVDHDGCIPQIKDCIPQVFQRVPSSSIEASIDTRFEYFISKILPTLRNGAQEQSHTVIVVPSYFDFVRLEKYLEDHNYNIASISEYSSQSKVDISKNEFKNGEARILLYSERYHFFRRSVVRNINHLVFYGIPTFKECYVEMCNETKERVTAVYSRLEYLALERVVGTVKANRMVKGDKDAFMFS